MVSERDVDRAEVQLELAGLVHTPQVTTGLAGIICDQPRIIVVNDDYQLPTTTSKIPTV